MQKIVFERGGKWYFWEKDFIHIQGPFSSKEEAGAALREYAVEQGFQEFKENDRNTSN